MTATSPPYPTLKGDNGMALVRVSNEEELDYPGDGLYYKDGQPFTGVFECRLPDGGLEAEEQYKDGLLSGRKRTWHPSGALQLEAECAWGVYHGRVREWYEDGRPAADAEYESGVRVRGTRWDEQGHVAEEFVLSEADPAYRIVIAARAAFETSGGTAEPSAAADRPRE